VRIIVLLFFLFTTSALAADVDREMKKTVDAFYNVYLTVRPSGVPSEKEQQKLKLYLSASLGKLLKGAAMAERKYSRTTKGEVPPLVEGDLFTSLFEGASAFTVLSCDSRTLSCLVEFSYLDPENKSSTTWKDKAYLIKDSRGWRVDDIEFLGNWQFMHKGRLKELLKQVIEEGN
jgi:hypothetical protein